jgi:hypothetical protein
MSFNLRRRVTQSKKNGLRSYTFSINRNWKNKAKDANDHKTVAYIQSMQEQHFDVPSNQAKLWQKIETETLRLLKDGTINQADAQKILDKAKDFLPKALPRSH